MLCGMHVHVQLPDPDKRLLRDARDASPICRCSSRCAPPRRSGIRARPGLKGYRLAAYSELPRTGVPELFHTKAEFDTYVAALMRAGVIADATHVWWAIRPSVAHPTLELRAPDTCTLVEDSVAIASLYRCLARRLYRQPHASSEVTAVDRAIAVENKWRAQRYGTDCIFASREGPVTISELLSDVIEATAADAEALHCCRGGRTLPDHRGPRQLRRVSASRLSRPW